MPRENRYFLPGHVWHITQLCHKRSQFAMLQVNIEDLTDKLTPTPESERE